MKIGAKAKKLSEAEMESNARLECENSIYDEDIDDTRVIGLIDNKNNTSNAYDDFLLLASEIPFRTAVVNYLLEKKGANLNCESKSTGSTALVLAMKSSSKETMLALLGKTGINIWAANKDKENPIFLASKMIEDSGKSKEEELFLKQLIDIFNVVETDPAKLRYINAGFLFAAINSNNLALVKHLLGKGDLIDLNANFGDGGATFLMIACKNFLDGVTDIDIVREIARDPRGNISQQDSIGITALHFAVNFGTIDLISAVLKNKQQLEIGDIDGDTPVQILARRPDFEELFKEFKEYRSAPLKLDNKTLFDSPEIDAMESFLKNHEKYAESRELIELLCSKAEEIKKEQRPKTMPKVSTRNAFSNLAAKRGRKQNLC